MKNLRFDPYNVLLAIATNTPVRHMTGFKVQGHVCCVFDLRLIVQDSSRQVLSIICSETSQVYLRCAVNSATYQELWV